MDSHEKEELFDKLEQMIKEVDGKFSEEETNTIKKMVKIYLAFEVLGSIGKVIKTTLLWFATMIGLYVAAKSNLIAWIGALK